MNATDTTGTSPEVQLLTKLNKVAKAISYVEKRGRNDKQNYSFATATDVLRDVRGQLQKKGILVIPSVVPGSLQHFNETGGKSFVTTVDLTYRFFDIETGCSIEVPWVGAGADIGGEKGLYKAMTGGLKYVLLQVFMLPTSDDPENDALSQPQPEEQEKVAKDAERPAAPLIPADRAKLILNAAISAGLATFDNNTSDPPSFSPVFKAVLATSGVTKIGALNVDQAEAIEAFIQAEGNAAEDAPRG